MSHNTKYIQISFNTMMIDKREMPWAYNGKDPHEPRFIKPSNHDCHCNPANVASEGFVHHAISDHNHAHNSHYDQFRRVYDRIEQVRKMQVTPEAIEIVDEFGRIKSRVNADLTAIVEGHEKRILTSDDDRQYGERFYLHNKQLEELEDKLDEIIAGGSIIPVKTFTFDNTDFDVSADDVVSLKKGEISENSSQVITGHDVYSVVSDINTRLSDFQNFYKQNSFYHFTECEVSDSFDGLTNIILKPFATSTIPSQLTNIRINIGSLPTGIDSGVARNMVMVIPATNSTTYIDWPTNFYPKTSQTVDFQCIDGVENVYWISEFSPNKFVVSGWQVNTFFDYLNNSVVFTSETDNSTISMQSVGNAPIVKLETSFDGIVWTPFIVNTTVITLSNVGDRVYFRAVPNSTNNSFALSTFDYNNFIIDGGRVSVSGNIMRLINSDAVDVIPTPYCFTRLFQGCDLITSAPKLPSIVLTEHCYDNMFQGCESLTSAPELPATELVYNCYKEMFKNCSSLNSLTTNQTSFNGCEDWLMNVSTNGTLYCSSTMGTNMTITRGSSACPNGWNVVNSDYLCFTAESPDSSVSMKAKGSAPAVNLVYSSAGSPWTPFIVGETVISLPNIGDKVYIKADTAGNAGFASYVSDYNNFVMTGRVAASGNIMSLLNAEEVPTSIPSAYCFACLFNGCSSLTVAPELPYTTLAYNCYFSMFNGCSSLTVAPKLPATTLADNCYRNMFKDCTSLTVAPELPATTLTKYCYNYMFWGCTSLTVAPELPATTLANFCYYYMFKDCTSLTVAPELPATTLASNCYVGMFYNCSSLTVAPELPATTLANSCYSNMFQNCSSITHVRTHQSSFTGCNGWLSGVSAIGTFECLSSLGTEETITRGESAVPTEWTVVNI